MEIVIDNDETCWVCGKTCVPYKSNPEHHKTMHHTIPKRLKPVNNVVVPVCKKCIRGMYAYAFKIDKTLGEMRKSSKEFFDLIKSRFTKRK